MDYIKSSLNNNKNDPKKFWKNIQEILLSKPMNKKYTILTDTDTNEPVEINNVADYINDFYINIGPNLEKNKCSGAWHYYRIECDNLLANISTSPDKIMNIGSDKY